MIKWICLVLCAVAAIFCIFLNRGGIEFKDLQALQHLIQQERENRLLQQLKAAEKVYAEQNNIFIAQQKQVSELKLKLAEAEKIEIKKPVSQKKKMLKNNPGLNNSSSSSQIDQLYADLYELQNLKTRKNQEINMLQKEIAKLDKAYEDSEYYRKHKDDYDRYRRNHKKRHLVKDNYPRNWTHISPPRVMITYFEHRTTKNTYENRIFEAKKTIARIDRIISEKNSEINAKKAERENTREHAMKISAKNDEIRQKNRDIDEKNYKNAGQYRTALREKEYKISNLKQQLETAQKNMEYQSQKMKEHAKAVADIKQGLSPEQKEISAKVALIQAHIYCEALDGGRKARIFLQALQKSEAKSWEQFFIYLKINEPSIYETIKDRKFRKKRGADLAALQLNIEGNPVFYSNGSNIEMAYQLIRKKY